jgi:photosystem II stability/assembly factor-like uncharacterized protein
MVSAHDLATAALTWRHVGPFRGGRVVAVAGHPTEQATFYMGTTGGGIWRTTDGGTYWENISDGFFARASVGALAVAESDPNVIYVGMGETTIRSSVSHGDGVYKSLDGGRTWVHCGLAATRNIGKIRIHPTNPDLVYVAALGHAHGPNPERGVYRSADGGKTWEQLLGRGDAAGAVDLSIDATNPRILYAAFWEGVHRAHELVSGGPGSGIFRSFDGGDTWDDLSEKPGVPHGPLGRIGISASPARAGRVWAIVEAKAGAVIRSDDWGETWERVNEGGEVRQRPWYYMHVIAHPTEPETVWVMNLSAWRSIDGGRTYGQVFLPHEDHHDIWIDPRNPQRMIEANDGGACVSFNGGASWSTIYNQPTTELYHVATDTQTPYRLYGAQQDNTTISVASRSDTSVITQADTFEVGGGESGYIAVRPDDPNIIYAGSFAGVITRYDRRNGQRQNIAAWSVVGAGWGAIDIKYRFNWTFPIILSPHDPNTLYITSQFVHRSHDEGRSWHIVSPDLTRNDPSKLGPSGGPITVDSNGMDYYCTIFAFAESPLVRGLLWAGSDDGLVHLSRDGGATWDAVTPPDLPTWSVVSSIDPSPHDPATAFLAVDRHRHDDFAPYLYKTHDYGASWEKIVNGLPEDDFARVLREDPARPGLLYAGTEAGVWVSRNDGATWRSLRRNLPVVPVHDLVIKDSDLVAATHGRGFWILDDLTPLREGDEGVLGEAVRLFPPRPAIRYRAARGFGGGTGPGKTYQLAGTTGFAARWRTLPNGDKEAILLDAGQNPPDGVLVYYQLAEAHTDDLSLTFLDSGGNEIATYRGRRKGEDLQPKVRYLPTEAGLNRFVWEGRYPDARDVPGAIYRSSGVQGPLAPPGEYQVRLTCGEASWTQPFTLRKDPRISATDAELQEQFAFLLEIRDKLSETNDAIVHLRTIREQAGVWEARARQDGNRETIIAAAEELKASLTTIEEALVQTRWKSSRDALTAPSKLNVKIATLLGVVGGADGAPTSQAREVFASVSEWVDAQLAQLAVVLDRAIPHFNDLIHDASFPALSEPVTPSKR